MPKSKYTPGRDRPTHPLIWCTAIICAIVAIAVIIGGIVVFIGYMVIHPRVPFIAIANAHLDAWQFDPAGLLQIQLTLILHAENDNRRGHAKFSETMFYLAFSGLKLARLEANPFEVRKNDSIDFRYVVQLASVPLDPELMQIVDYSLRRDRITFELKGSSRAQWRVWILGSAKFLCHLHCQLNFHYSNGSYMPKHCSSKAK